MCDECLADYVGDDGPDMPEDGHYAAELIELLYFFGEGSSPLHSVIENTNIEDRYMKVDRDLALTQYPRVAVAIAEAVVEYLTPLTLRQRATVIGLFYERHYGIGPID